MNWDDDVFTTGDVVDARPEFTPTAPKKPTPGHVYIVREPGGAYKIGRSQQVNQRIAGVAAGLPQGRVEVILTIPISDPPMLEAALHARFRRQRISGEWFRLTDADLERLIKEYSRG